MNPENKDKIISLRHLLHANPELSMQETNTRHFLINFLKKFTRLKSANTGTGSARCIMLRIPALP